MFTGPGLRADGRTNAGCAGRARLEAGALFPGVALSWEFSMRLETSALS